VSLEHRQTVRLDCARLRAEHADELSNMLLDPRVYRSLWPREEPPTQIDVAERVARLAGHRKRHGFGLWPVRDRHTGNLVGRGGLQHTYSVDFEGVEATWAIVPERWGQGLATELARAAVRVAFSELELLELVALTLPHNVASRRVIEKTGFAYERDIEHAGLPNVLTGWEGMRRAVQSIARLVGNSRRLTAS
jgi:[ribosomal protein S5]-alanine N-acetyltransferase